MTPELRIALAALIGAAQNAEVDLNAILDDSRAPNWIRHNIHRNALSLAAAVRAVEAAMKAEVMQ